MASVLDVAAYLLKTYGSMDAMKLQKLCYYAEAWHLVWDEKSLFAEEIEAWANGPVIRDLYWKHRGRFMIDHINGGDITKLTEEERETIDVVHGAYGHLTGMQLSNLTHSERPWLEARDGTPEGARSATPVDRLVMQDFYASRVA